MAPSAINYKDLYFEHKELKRIHGEPTFEILHQLEKDLKTNAHTVPSTLGGGRFGHLGLVLNPFKYSLLSNTPFQFPQHPGVYVVLQGLTRDEAHLHKERYEQQLALFHEVFGVQKALMNQIIEAIEATYLDGLRSTLTNTINQPIYVVLQYLFSTYRRITPSDLADYEDAIKKTIYNPAEPIINLYNTLQKFFDCTEHQGLPYSEQ